MPSNRKSNGDHALSNAERQARYRARRQSEQATPTIRYRRPQDRRSRPQRWQDAVDDLLRLQADTPLGSILCPTACTERQPQRRSRPSRISISTRSPQSNRHEATAAIEVVVTQGELLKDEKRLTPTTPIREDSSGPGSSRTSPNSAPLLPGLSVLTRSSGVRTPGVR